MMKVYKQISCEGCLPSCLSLLRQKKYGTTFSTKEELGVLYAGMKAGTRNYTLDIAKAFSEYAKIKTGVYVDNKYFCKKLSLICDSGFIKITHKKVNLGLLKSLLQKHRAVAVYLDSYFLHKDCHYPHWVVLDRLGKKAVVIDPWEGKRRFLKPEKLMGAIYNLKTYLRFCPLAVVLE